MKKRILAILLMAACLLCSGCNKAINEGYKLFKSSPLGLQIEYPAKWELVKDNDKKTVLFSTAKEGFGDYYQENLAIVVKELGKYSFEEYYAKHRDALPATFPGYTEIENSEVLLDNQTAYRLEFSSQDGDSNENQIKCLQYLVNKKDKVYFITYTGHPGSYDYYMPQIKTMIKTFKANS